MLRIIESTRFVRILRHAFLTLAFFVAVEGFSQEEDWEYEISASLWTGNTGVEVLPLDFSRAVDIDLPDFLDNYQLGFLLRGEAVKERFGVLLDVGYIQLSASDEPEVPNVDRVSVDVNSTLVTLSGIFRIHGSDKFRLDALPGIQYYHSDSEIAVQGSMSGTASSNRSNWDPILGLRAKYVVFSKLDLGLFGSIGGFGASSQSTTQFGATAGYRLLELFSVHLGYRLIDWDFDEVEERRLISQNISGVLVGFKLSF
ncbi:MAG: hypothetical protein AAGA85_01860 [Bacteroidota bacterium]